MQQLTIRRGLLVVAVALLIAVAGCSGPSGGATPTANATANGTENATTTPASSTDTPGPVETVTEQQTPTETETETTSAPDLEATVSGAGLDGEELNNATRTAVEEAGSYTYQSVFFTASQSRRGQRVNRQVRTTRADFDAAQGIRVSEQSFDSPRLDENTTRTVYTDGNTSYRKRITSEGTNYSMQEGASTGSGGINPVNTSAFSQNLTFVTNGLVWEENGTTTVDDTTVTEYTLAGLEDQESYTEGTRATLTDISGALYIDDEDVVRQASLGYTTESRAATSTIQFQFTLSDVGSTTVEEPEWTSEAEDSDSS